jgi:DNA replication ATP-dependent helicase Dna2
MVHNAWENSTSPSPTKKKARKVLGEVKTGGAGNKMPAKRTSQKTPSSSPEMLKTGRKVGGGLKTPKNVFRAGKRGVLEGRPVLRDVFNGAM